MILVDANLLVYAYMEGVPQHGAAKSWLEEKLAGPSRIGLPWASLLAFVRISSNRRIFEHPSPIVSSWRQVEEWLAVDPVWIPEPTTRHQEILGELLGRVGNEANLVPDAHLAALRRRCGLPPPRISKKTPGVVRSSRVSSKGCQRPPDPECVARRRADPNVGSPGRSRRWGSRLPSAIWSSS